MSDHVIRLSRLTAEREQEICDATIRLVCEQGYDALTMDAVAARTKCSKATLYRQWTSKPRLVAVALRHTRPVLTADIDTGSLAGDLRELVRRMGTESNRDVDLMRGLSQAAVNNPDLREALREVLIDPDTDALGAMLRRAVWRGELATDSAAAPFLTYALVGPMIGRRILDDRDADAEFMTRYLEAVILPALDLT
ncbi:TetR/AcrR family transcriptional regulator [Streptomyces sp. NBC_01537]|uniref:TetR/AcrR family transcriptional regulator n=1 Tax=Streptomyces sp. NBC_01537 TaxID=2903896 RepID=UPI003865201C